MAQPMEGVRILEVAQFTFVPGRRRGARGLGRRRDQGRARGSGATRSGAWSGCSGWTSRARGARSSRSWRALTGASAASGSRSTSRRRGPCSKSWSGQRRVPDQLPARPARQAADRRGGHPRRSTRTSSTSRGSGFGARGPRPDKGGYDSTAFWARGGQRGGRDAAGLRRDDGHAGRRLRRLDGRHDDRRRHRGRAVRAAGHRARRRSSTCRCSGSARGRRSSRSTWR